MFVKRGSGKFEDEFLSFLQAKQIYGEYQTLDGEIQADCYVRQWSMMLLVAASGLC